MFLALALLMISPWQTCPDGSRIRKSQTCPTPTPTPSPTPTPTPTPSPAPLPSGVPSGYTVKLATALKCDGVTDDTAALRSNIAALASYQALQLPAGTCVTSNTLTIQGKTNVMMFGAGKDLTTLKATNAAYSAVILERDTGAILQGFNVEASAASRTSNPSTDGLFIDVSSGVKVDGVRVRNVGGGGIVIRATNGASVQNSEVDGSHADAFHITGGSQNITLQFNVARNAGDDSFASIAYAPGVNRNISILDNQSYDGAWASGVGIEGTVGAKIYRNKVYRSGAACIRIDSQGSYSTGPDDQIDLQSNYLESCVTRTGIGHGAIMIYVNWAGGTTGVVPMVRVTGSGNQIVSPAGGIGIRAFGYSATNNVQATLLNTAMTGVATPYSIGAYASVAH